jgi:hypothetical protein
MTPENYKTHKQIFIALTVLFYLCTSYVFGSLNPFANTTTDDRTFVMIIFVCIHLTGQFMYREYYTEKDKTKDKSN